jgi:nitrogen fixation protein NifU and related proteins
MADLEALYREVVLAHNRAPRNFRRLPLPCQCTDAVNALCGDRLRICLRLDDGGRLAEVAFEGSGCAISVASASMMTEAVTGRTQAQALALVAEIGAMLAGGSASPPEGDVAALAGVREFPSRVKCAALAWEALRASLAEGAQRVSTEDNTQAQDGH